MAGVKDLTGQKIGRLRVISRDKNDAHGTTRWLCECDCGNKVLIRGGDLRRVKGTRSCGCLAREKSSDRLKKHGKTGTRLHNIWMRMQERCYNPNHVQYAKYGGKGIDICEEWKKDFQVFYDWAMSNGYSDELTIDRIDNDSNYCPANCRWATIKEQNNNKTNNHLVTMNGETKNVTQWCQEYGVNRGVAYKKLKAGIEPEEIFRMEGH